MINWIKQLFCKHDYQSYMTWYPNVVKRCSKCYKVKKENWIVRLWNKIWLTN